MPKASTVTWNGRLSAYLFDLHDDRFRQMCKSVYYKDDLVILRYSGMMDKVAYHELSDVVGLAAVSVKNDDITAADLLLTECIELSPRQMRRR